MTKISETVAFFGSGPVAAASLRRLVVDFPIEAVVTKPRAPHHKGDVPVLEAADELGLRIYTVEDRKSLDALMAKSPLASRLAILIDFGIIVSQQVIDYFELGIVNSHFSLLPEWRGADPITFSILSGQPTTGISLMLLTAGMDEGPLLAQASYRIPQKATTPQLTEALIDLSATALQATIPRYLSGAILPQEQAAITIASSKRPTYSRRLEKTDSILDWQKSALQLEREVRAFDGWPKSRTKINGLEIVVTKARVVEDNGTPGAWSVQGKLPMVYCGSGALVVERLKPAGKQEMTGEAFLAGYRKFLGTGTSS